MSCPPGCHQAPHRTNSILAWGRENAFAKRGIITLAVIHLSGFPGEVFYYDFSAPSPAVGLGLLTHKGPIHGARGPQPTPPPPGLRERSLCPSPQRERPQVSEAAWAWGRKPGPPDPRTGRGPRARGALGRSGPPPVRPRCAGRDSLSLLRPSLCQRKTQRLRKGTLLVSKVGKGPGSPAQIQQALKAKTCDSQHHPACKGAVPGFGWKNSNFDTTLTSEQWRESPASSAGQELAVLLSSVTSGAQGALLGAWHLLPAAAPSSARCADQSRREGARTLTREPRPDGEAPTQQWLRGH